MERAAGTERTILLVEAEEPFARETIRVLGGWGYGVAWVSEGEDAVSKLRENPDIALVLVDVDLPGEGGISLASRMGTVRRLPVVFLAAEGDRSTVEKLRGVSRYGFVPKNAGEFVLRSAVDMAFELFEAHDRARKSEETFRRIVETAQEGIWMLDARGTTSYANHWMADMLGYVPEEMLGRALFDFMDDDARLEATRLLERRRQGISERHEFRFRKKDGTPLWAEVATNAMVDDRGAFLGALGMIVDRTERRRSEEAIRGLLREKELLLAEVHHRVKNNLLAIASLLSLQERRVASDEAGAALRGARSRVQSMMVLYDRIYHTGGYETMALDGYLAPLAREIVALFPCGGRVRVRMDLEPVPLPVRTILPLGIAVNELLTNAMKHAFVGRPGGTVCLAGFPRGDRVVVVVRDDGPGLPEDVVPETSPGFGLQVVSLLVRQIGGRMTVRRAGGTCWTLEIPQGEAAYSPVPSSLPGGRAGKP